MSATTLLHTALESSSTTTLCGVKRTKRNTVDYESFLSTPVAEQCATCYELVQATAQEQEQEQEQESTVESTQEQAMLPTVEEQERMLPTVEEAEAEILSRIELLIEELHSISDKQYSIVAKRASYNPANRSTAEKPVDIVWRECTSMLITGEFDENGVRYPYARKDVTQRCLELGVNIHTIRTQTQACIKAGGVRPERKR